MGQQATILVHEATFENSMLADAKQKMHSTFQEAIDVAKRYLSHGPSQANMCVSTWTTYRMDAKVLLLNHFSQRYPKLPKLADMGDHEAGAAARSMVIGCTYDMMRIRLDKLPLLDHFHDYLEALFDEKEH